MNIMQRKRLKGFTLIELMIVVAIIGILAAVAVPKFADLVTKSKEASTKGSLGSIRSAVTIYYGDTEGENPDNLFVGLTTGNKYMPPVGGAASLGKYEIPRVVSQGNPGFTTGQFVNLNDATQGVSVAAGGAGTGAFSTRPLYYNSAEGNVQINVAHKDTKGNIWTSY